MSTPSIARPRPQRALPAEPGVAAASWVAASAAPAPAARTSPAAAARLRERLAPVVGGALAGERVAVDNGCELVPLLPDGTAKLRAIERARSQALHAERLSQLLQRLGGGSEAAVAVDPRWKRLRRDFSAAAKQADVAACVVVQELMLPTLGNVLYQHLALDDTAAATARRILAGRSRQLDDGVEQVKALLRRHPKAVQQSLVWAHRRVMPGLLAMVCAGCHALLPDADVAGPADRASRAGRQRAATGGAAGGHDADGEPADDDADDGEAEAAALEGLRADAIDAYGASLDRAGFDAATTWPLLASLAGDPARPRAGRRLRLDPPPAFVAGPAAREAS